MIDDLEIKVRYLFGNISFDEARHTWRRHKVEVGPNYRLLPESECGSDNLGRIYVYERIEQNGTDRAETETDALLG